jgi:serine/threonine protein kinase/regulation of enolase protein 1 (concanavalin A-like superfamily)
MEPKKANDPDELGGWRINGRLGEGGFGTVFLAEKGAQKAAIKVIRQEFVEEVDARTRLATEAEVLSKLSDPSIGKILDSDLAGDLPWIATEFINGPTLEAKVKFEGPLEEVAWFNLAANIFHAIVSANKLGIIHKDIKPSNIILGETGNKLIDFGIAHISGQTRTLTFGDREGSTLFSSPEHFTIRANPKMDVFSAAATLAFAAKGSAIWDGDNDLQLMRSINEDLPKLDGLTENQIIFLTPLFEKNPSDRPSALEAHQSALGYIEFLLGKSRKPTPLKGRSRFRKFIHSKQAISSVALVLVASAAFAVNAQNQKPHLNLPVNLSVSQNPSALQSPSASTEKTNGISQDAVKGDLQAKSTECQRLTNELKTAEAIEVCLVAAKSGDAVAMNALGYNYYVTMKEDAKGIEWYKKAAKAGSAVAMYNLGTLYIAKNNSVEAEKWFKQCIDSDYSFCAFNYGSLLEKSKRISEAKVVYQKGVKLGDSGSAQNLGLIYVNEQNWAKAREVFTVGANLNNHLSMYSLAMVLIKNYSDVDTGCSWLRKALQVKTDYNSAREAVIEICKNRNYEVAQDVEILKGTIAPYQVTQSSTDRKVGDWVIWLKTPEVDASSATGIQYRLNGSKDNWRYVFYGYYTNASGIYSYISERPGLEGSCLEFRLVRESRDGYITKIWEMPASICKTN